MEYFGIFFIHHGEIIVNINDGNRDVNVDIPELNDIDGLESDEQRKNHVWKTFRNNLSELLIDIIKNEKLEEVVLRRIEVPYFTERQYQRTTILYDRSKHGSHFTLRDIQEKTESYQSFIKELETAFKLLEMFDIEKCICNPPKALQTQPGNGPQSVSNSTDQVSTTA